MNALILIVCMMAPNGGVYCQNPANAVFVNKAICEEVAAKNVDKAIPKMAGANVVSVSAECRPIGPAPVKS